MSYRQEAPQPPIRPSDIRKDGLTVASQNLTALHHREHVGVCLDGPHQGMMKASLHPTYRAADMKAQLRHRLSLGPVKDASVPANSIRYGWYHWSPFGVWRWVPDNLGRSG